MKEREIERLLTEPRQRIDEIDAQVVALLNERAKEALKIAGIKREGSSQFFAPHRESQVFKSLRNKNHGPLPHEAVESIFTEIISATRSLEKPLCVVYLGPSATFTHLASVKVFGSSTHYVPVKSIPDVFAEVERGRADHGVVPIENSTEGVVNHTLDMFMDSDLKIFSEVLLEVSQHLLANCSLKEIKRVYSHSQSFAQCRRWIEQNLSQAELLETSSTAQAAEMAAQEEGSSAIASELAAKLYNLKVLVKKIEDVPHNYTRFLVIGKEISKRSGDDKTSVMFSIKDKVGALFEILQIFARRQINLTKIESRPSRKRAWDYVFFIDLHGHSEDQPVAEALEELEHHCLLCKVLGSYPRAALVKKG